MARSKPQRRESFPRGARHVVTVICLVLPQVCVAAQNDAEERLAMALARSANSLLKSASEVSLAHYDAAAIILDDALGLAPDDLELWHLRRAVALASGEDERRSTNLIEASNRAIARLAPDDQVIRLWRLGAEIDRHQTAEDRVRAYGSLLADSPAQRLGAPVASRLAHDVARLHYRTGNSDAYRHWLAKSIEWDRANIEAMGEAVGYFRARTDDPFGEAELLLSLVLAAPTDIAAHTELARLLLEHGAFSPAARILRVAYDYARQIDAEVDPGLITDLAIALWGSGRADDAIDLIDRYDRARDDAARERYWRENPMASRVQLAQLSVPRIPTLAAVRAAIAARQGRADASDSLDRVLRAYKDLISQIEGDDAEVRRSRDELRLRQAWVAAWLGAPVEEVQMMLAALDGELTPEAAARFEAWREIRQDDPNAAVQLLAGLDEPGSATQLTRAEAHLAAGQSREAALDFLAVVRAQPGTAIGVWAADRLAELLGQRAPISQLASRLQSLIDAVPRSFDRYPLDPTLAVSIRVQPVKPRFSAFEPPIVDLEIANNSAFPLAIDSAGPIRPAVVLQFDIGAAGRGAREQITAAVLEIDRRLRLMPRERLTISLDLRRFETGHHFEQLAVNGWTVRVDATINPLVETVGPEMTVVVRPLLLGSRDQTPSFRIEGVRVDEQWVAAALDRVTGEHPDPETFSLLAQIATAPPGGPRSLPEARCDEIATTLALAWSHLTAVDQAWTLAILPEHERMAPILATARKSEEHLVRLAYLLSHLEDENDAMIDAARRSGDESLARFVDAYVAVLFPDTDL